ncbi:dihydrolipoyllysine-residue acetyltransferase [Terasakiispira papahanaumokuakeensis]|uniref:Acetyltransferase component of pyruvate dehydrogenase complex n=1 Tax=Terasakiispira papahanaumokuakeensis TaxID=197479 RepID=A0A1E2VAX0_9GAMM|nr:pyruvate dehydrogenase complex dihydrolipoyllysine-residue acetyltransferase [Terasakiispira papahanaumokuakeensis]ODC04002.1 dihydrolipoyllysine-residue acetyltransferase [Terasakiispira papahanaumokuakeensis]
MSTEIIKVPDIGGSEDVEVIEISIKEGDRLDAEDTMIVLESDKASMDVPAPKAGVVKKILLSEGDKVSEGAEILEIELEGEGGGDAPAASRPVENSAETQEQPAEAQAETQSEPQQSSHQQQASRQEIRVPDLGGATDVEVIEVTAGEGDAVEVEDGLFTLETDKASMDVPAPYAGKLVEMQIKVGDHVNEGDLIGYIETTSGAAAPEAAASAPASETSAPASEPAPQAQPAASGGRQEIHVPDLGGATDVEVIEVAVNEGDDLNEEDGLFTLETDKASMDVPAPYAGKLVEMKIKVGDRVNEGDLIGVIEVAGAPAASNTAAQASSSSSSTANTSAPAASSAPAPAASSHAASSAPESTSGKVHAGPAVRMLARELGVDLVDVPATGPRGRLLKEDLENYVKSVMRQHKASGSAAAPAATGGAGIPPIPAVDFSKFGEVEEKPMGRLMKAGATNLHRSWLNVPHVTQFDKADITELEAFRKSMKAEAEKQDAKLTPLPFLIKACAHALRQFPQFNVSLSADGTNVIWKKYVHIGIAVDTPDGLLVPVIRDADKKSIFELARESVDLAKRAQKKQLKGDEMKGGCFTISSLGSIGGTAFTPIVNAPEVAILGVSKASVEPVWNGSEFEPRQMLPLCLSYDHRAVNGADAARFTAYLARIIADIRQILL